MKPEADGQYVDKKGVPIYPGDLLKAFHHKDGRRNIYLYHTVVREGDFLRMVPTCSLEPSKQGQGGKCLLKAMATQDVLLDSEVIQGLGPNLMQFFERPRRSVVYL